MRFLCFYLMKDAPERVQSTALKHPAYWRDLGLRGYLGGPFADRSGGLSPSRPPLVLRPSGWWPTTHSWRRACLSAIG